jgi:hypothetical protein
MAYHLIVESAAESKQSSFHPTYTNVELQNQLRTKSTASRLDLRNNVIVQQLTGRLRLPLCRIYGMSSAINTKSPFLPTTLQLNFL